MSSFLENTLMLVPKRCIGPFRLGMKVEEALQYLENTSPIIVDWEEIIGTSDHGFLDFTDDWRGFLPGRPDNYVRLSFCKETGTMVRAGFARGCEVVFYGVKLLEVTEEDALELLKKYGGEPLELEPGCYEWLTLGVSTYNAVDPDIEPFQQVCITDHSFQPELVPVV
jgi:hypothetical protein